MLLGLLGTTQKIMFLWNNTYKILFNHPGIPLLATHFNINFHDLCHKEYWTKNINKGKELYRQNTKCSSWRIIRKWIN